jgi:hypothetical protein
MMNKIFDAIGRTITSLAAVIFVMLMTITGMILFSHTLFAHIFPEGMARWEKIAATWFMALGWEFTVLITTCNTKHINKHVPAIMAICSGIIVLFFIQAFDTEQTTLILAQRWFVGVLAATINYIYADLFYAKWRERKDYIDYPLKVIQLESLLRDAEQNYNELQSDMKHSQSLLIEARQMNNDLQQEVIQLKRFKNEHESKLICPYCKVNQQSSDSLRVHKGRCSQNPKNKEI